MVGVTVVGGEIMEASVASNLTSSALLVFIAVSAFISGTLFGYNNGFDIGVYIGHLDKQCNFLHNGVKE